MYSVWMTKIKEFQFYWSSQNILGRMDYIKHTERNKVILLKKSLNRILILMQTFQNIWSSVSRKYAWISTRLMLFMQCIIFSVLINIVYFQSANIFIYLYIGRFTDRNVNNVSLFSYFLSAYLSAEDGKRYSYICNIIILIICIYPCSNKLKHNE